jgi:hypothetical protein
MLPAPVFELDAACEAIGRAAAAATAAARVIFFNIIIRSPNRAFALGL